MYMPRSFIYAMCTFLLEDDPIDDVTHWVGYMPTETKKESENANTKEHSQDAQASRTLPT